MDGVKAKYLEIMKMRLNLILVDPNVNDKKRSSRDQKRVLKQRDKLMKKELSERHQENPNWRNEEGIQ